MSPLFLSLLLNVPGTVTYTCPATKLEKVVEVLAQQTGEQLSLTGPMEGQFVVVRFKDTPVEDALKRLAEAVKGKWATSGKLRILQSDDKGNTQDAGIRDSIRKYLAVDPKTEKWGEKEAEKLIEDALALNEVSDQSQDKWQKFQLLDRAGPRKRLVKQICRLIGESGILNVPENARMVYALHPTQMQRALPAGVVPLMSQFVRDESIQQEALKKKGYSATNSPETGFYIEALQPRDTPPTNYKTCLMTIKRSMGSIAVTVLLAGNADSNNIVINDNIGIQDGLQQTASKNDVKVEGEYKGSPDSLLMAKAFVTGMGASPDVNLTDEERRRIKVLFSDLETNELLRLAPSEVLLQTAEAMDVDMAASVSDISVMAFTYGMRNGPAKLSTFFNEGMCPWRVTKDEKGLTLTSIDSLFGFKFSIPRRAISKFCKDVDKSGISIDAIADLVAATPQSETAQVAVMFACIPFENMTRNLNLYEGQSALRAYANLDPASRAKAKNGGFVTTFGSMQPALKSAINQFVYHDTGVINMHDPSFDTANVYGQTINLEGETTSLFPGGLPFNARVTFKVRDIDSLFTISTYQGGYSSTEAASDDDVANRLAWQERTQGMDGHNQTTKLGTGVLKQLDVSIEFAEKASSQSRFRLMPHFKPEDQKELKDLPEERRKALEEKLAKQREQLRDVTFGPNRSGKIKP